MLTRKTSSALYLSFKDFILNEHIPNKLKNDSYIFANDIIDRNRKNENIYFYNLDDLITYMNNTDFSENIYNDIYIKFIIPTVDNNKLRDVLEKLINVYKITNISLEYIYEKMKSEIYKTLFINYNDELLLNPKQGYVYDIITYWDMTKPINFDLIKDNINSIRKYYNMPQNILEIIKARLLDITLRLKYNDTTKFSPLYYILYEDDKIIICFHKLDNILSNITIFYNLKYINHEIISPLLCTITTKNNEYLTIKTNKVSDKDMAIIANDDYDKIVNINHNHVIHIVIS